MTLATLVVADLVERETHVNHCAHLMSIRVRDGALQLTLRSGDHDIAVHAPLSHAQAHALRHAHAAERLRDGATGNAALLDLLTAVADAAGGAVTAVVIDLRGATPSFRLRVGSPDRCSEVPVSANDMVLVLARNRLPVEVATPPVPEDWDDALARLVAEEA